MADAPRFDPRRLRPGELCRILNSTPLGEVTSERVLQRHRNRAGLRIDDGTGKGIDLFRYVAWLAVRRERGAKPEPAVPAGLSGYELHRERARQRIRRRCGDFNIGPASITLHGRSPRDDCRPTASLPNSLTMVLIFHRDHPVPDDDSRRLFRVSDPQPSPSAPT